MSVITLEDLWSLPEPPPVVVAPSSSPTLGLFSDEEVLRDRHQLELEAENIRTQKRGESVVKALSQRHSKASRAGADSMSQEALKGQAGKIITAVVASMSRKDRAPGLTREEIADITGIRDTSVCGRVSDLVRAGKLQEPGIHRIGSAGRMQGVLWAGACPVGEPITCTCKDCGKGASSRLWLLPCGGYLTVRKCEQTACFWWEVA